MGMVFVHFLNSNVFRGKICCLSGALQELPCSVCLHPPSTTGVSRDLENPGWGLKEAGTWPLKEWLHLASSAYPRSKLNQHLEADPSGASERGWLQTPTSQYRHLTGTDTILPWDFSTRTFQTLPLKLLSSESVWAKRCYQHCLCSLPSPVL